MFVNVGIYTYICTHKTIIKVIKTKKKKHERPRTY